MTIKSARGIPLVVQGSKNSEDLLTVELYEKWYVLWWVFGDCSTVAVPFCELESFAEPGESAFVDHVPNPVCVRRYAEAHNLTIPILAEELIEGRWFLR